MALSVVTSGTLTANGTEQTLTTQTVVRRFQAMIDLSAMVNGDAVEVKVKVKTLTGSTAALAFYGLYTNVQSNPVIATPELASYFSYAVTFKQLSGSNHNYAWSVNDVGDILPTADTVLLSAGTGTGQLDFTSGVVKANMTQMNGISTSSVTTINANVGTTQPVNFTGTGASALAKSDTVDIAGAAVSTSSAQIGVNAVQIGGSATAATQHSKSAATIISGTAITGTLSSTQASTDLTEATNDHYVGRMLVWTSGGLQNSAVFITAYNGTTKVLTFTAIPTGESPANNDTFVIV